MGSSDGRSSHRFHRRPYRGGRPSRLAQVLNRQSAFVFAHHRFSVRTAMLEIAGGPVAFPMVVTYRGQRFVVAMPGANTNWVRDLQDAGGRAVLGHGRREDVRLVEIPPGGRAAILRACLQVVPGGPPHIPVDRHAPDEEFARVAPLFPVFRVVPGERGRARPGGM